MDEVIGCVAWDNATGDWKKVDVEGGNRYVSSVLVVGLHTSDVAKKAR